MFDLPQDLRTLNTPRPIRSPTPEAGSASSKAYSAAATPTNGQGTAGEQSPEDWGFLRDFGDAGDEFFELDVQLRGLLEKNFDFELGNMSFG